MTMKREFGGLASGIRSNPVQTILKMAIALTMVIAVATAHAQNATVTFDNAQSLSKLVSTGAVSIDSTHKHGGTGSLKVEPGATV